MAFRMTGRVLGALARERNDVQPALRKVWKAHEHTDGLVRELTCCDILYLVPLVVYEINGCSCDQDESDNR